MGRQRLHGKTFDENVMLDENGCHAWTGGKRDRYGVWWDGGIVMLAHRFAYERKFGALDDGVHLTRNCGNDLCVNPEHMRHRTNSPDFDKNVAPITMSGCMPWTGGVGSHGYGLFWNGVKQILAHRHAYERAMGFIPSGMQIDHKCRNRLCVNPEHMEVVTQRENILRGTAPSAVNASKEMCSRGHLFLPENTYLKMRRSGYEGRECRICMRLMAKARRDRKRP